MIHRFRSFPKVVKLVPLLTRISGLLAASLNIATASEPPFVLPPSTQISTLRTASIATSKGTMIFDLFPEDAPWHVANFKYLADKKVYRGSKFTIFHPGYVIQGGIPLANKELYRYRILPEFSTRPHRRGTLGMARRQDLINSERTSDATQFHLILGHSPHMDGLYTVFGELRDGDEVLEMLEKGDSIEDVTVFVRP